MPGCHVTRRHDHPYEVGEWGIRRCTCGSRNWVLSAGQLVKPEVVCAKCKRRNWPATAYENGVIDGRKEAASALAQAQGAASPPAF